MVPLQLRSKIMETYHDSVFSAHRSPREMMASVARQFFWNGMRSDIQEYVDQCGVCQLVKRAHKGIVPPLGPHPETKTVGERWSLDFLEKLKVSKNGYRHCIIAVEHVTRFTLIEPLKTLTAAETCEFLFKRLFMTMGIPCCILTDNGSAWRSHLTKLLTDRLGIDSLKCMAYHSQANGMAERFIQKVQRRLQLYVSELHDDWDEYVPPIQYAMNSSICRTLGPEDTPYNLFFGRDARTSLDVEWENISPYNVNNEVSADWKYEKVLKMTKAYLRATTFQDRMLPKYRQFYDRKVYDPEIRVGDRCVVRVKKAIVGRSRALTKTYEGPVRVLEVNDYSIICVPVARPDAKPKMISKRRVKLIKAENYAPTAFDPVLENWNDLDDQELIQEPTAEELVEDEPTQKGIELPDEDSLGEEQLEHTTQSDANLEKRNELRPETLDTVVERKRPRHLRSRPTQRQFGADFITDMDQLGVLKSQEFWGALI